MLQIKNVFYLEVCQYVNRTLYSNMSNKAVSKHSHPLSYLLYRCI